MKRFFCIKIDNVKNDAFGEVLICSIERILELTDENVIYMLSDNKRPEFQIVAYTNKVYLEDKTYTNRFLMDFDKISELHKISDFVYYGAANEDINEFNKLMLFYLDRDLNKIVDVNGVVYPTNSNFCFLYVSTKFPNNEIYQIFLNKNFIDLGMERDYNSGDNIIALVSKMENYTSTIERMFSYILDYNGVKVDRTIFADSFTLSFEESPLWEYNLIKHNDFTVESNLEWVWKGKSVTARLPEDINIGYLKISVQQTDLRLGNTNNDLHKIFTQVNNDERAEWSYILSRP